ncbi:trypsin-like peptidase domain-containing protein [Paracraurococcus lichenis]|uniref:Serine protease n=1 Tax=Paracraurococcus lichenis TaxID=3064888 RepID=A0ABT9DWH5_9PROT|nr:trypsin-like peptidase domain-containing protein [Paracraurococcus sp. LOR1-02]MDO9708150.1 trypsin-like peptidase domain-containing protein [Paracraurococcus sp. LOR1-02]
MPRPLLLALALLVQAVPALAETQPFHVINRTGADATVLNAVRSPRGAANDWGGNLLRPDRPLTPGGGFRVRPAEDAGCRFDLRLVLADGRESVLRDQDICAAREIEMAAAARPAAPLPVPVTPPPQVEQQRPNTQARRISTGTGFLVAPDRVMTNHHVVDGCDRIILKTPDGRWLGAVPPARVDEKLDLALLAVPGAPGPVLPFRSGPPVRRGEGVVVYGFPLAGILSDAVLTRGEINGLAGLADNRSQFQISAPVQPGNSGGPMLDMQGHLVGVIVSKLNAQRIAQQIGDIPQNINFAVKGEAALSFLQRAGLQPRLAESTGPERGAADIGEVAGRSALFIRCER